MAEAPLTSALANHGPLVFLGGGRITSALVAGLRLAKFRATILVHDRNPEKLRALRRQYNVRTTPDLLPALEQRGILFLAVRPSSVRDVLQQVRELPVRPTLGVSLAAGIPLKKLKDLAPSLHWARAMPSPVSRTRVGLTALAFDRGVSSAARKRVRQIFRLVGSVLEIPENQFDAFTVTYSVSHGYHALATLAAAAQGLSLDRETSLMAAAHALADAIVSWRQGSYSLQDLLHEAATPGGVAAATMRAMDGAGYREAIIRGLRDGLAQAKRNAKD